MDSSLNVTRQKQCLPIILIPSFSNISINIIRFTMTIFYLMWLISLILFKDFRNRKMIYLHNLNLIGLFNCAVGISFLFFTTCTVLDVQTCTAQSYLVFLSSTLSGYGIAALAIYRLYLLF